MNKSLFIAAGLLSLFIAGGVTWQVHFESAISPCPQGQTYVTRVMGGWKLTPPSDPYGMCIADEELEDNLVKDPSWTDRLLTFLSLKNEARAAGNTYHVKQNGGGDCTTITACAGRLQPGDTLVIHAGTYTERNPSLPGGTSWSAPITIKANPGDRVIMNGFNQTGSIFAENASYAIVDGIIFDQGFGWITGGHVRLQNLEVSELAGGSGGQGIIGCTEYCEAINLHVHHIAWTQDNQMTCPVGPLTNGFGYCHGIYWGHSDYNLVEGGEYHHISGFCTHPNPGDGWTIRNVTCHDSGGILTYGSNYLFYNNISYNNYNPQNNQPANALTGYSYGGSNKYFNNTIVGHASIQGTNNVVRNNIFTRGLEEQQPGSNTLSNNLTTNPNFVNPSGGDFHLQSSSPAINAGLTLPDVPCDFDGNGRPAGSAYDIGAYEYGGSPSSDCKQGPVSSPGPSPTPVACHLLDSSKPVPPGRGAAYNPLSPQKELLISVSCDTQTATFNLGNNQQTTYIYHQGYIKPGGSSTWMPVTFSGSNIQANAWYPAKATYFKAFNPNELSQTGQFAAYMCHWTGYPDQGGGGWKCGCRDQQCSQPYWQLQEFKR